MSRAGAPKTAQSSIRVPDEVLAQIDELATLMQRPRSFVVVQALRDFIAAELEDVRSVVASAAQGYETLGALHEQINDLLLNPQRGRIDPRRLGVRFFIAPVCSRTYRVRYRLCGEPSYISQVRDT